MKNNKWEYETSKMLFMSENDLKETYKNTYADYCIQYKNTLEGLIANCKNGQIILVYIHSDFPQTEQDHAIVYKDSPPYNRLVSSDDYNIVVDIDEYFNILHKHLNKTT